MPTSQVGVATPEASNGRCTLKRTPLPDMRPSYSGLSTSGLCSTAGPTSRASAQCRIQLNKEVTTTPATLYKPLLSSYPSPGAWSAGNGPPRRPSGSSTASAGRKGSRFLDKPRSFDQGTRSCEFKAHREDKRSSR